MEIAVRFMAVITTLFAPAIAPALAADVSFEEVKKANARSPR